MTYCERERRDSAIARSAAGDTSPTARAAIELAPEAHEGIEVGQAQKRLRRERFRTAATWLELGENGGLGGYSVPGQLDDFAGFWEECGTSRGKARFAEFRRWHLADEDEDDEVAFSDGDDHVDS